MTATLTAPASTVGVMAAAVRRAGAQLAQASAAHTACPLGPRTRVRLLGVGDAPTVRASLTRAWRLAGQPIVVVLAPHWGPTERAAVDWAAEHAVAGIGLEVRHTVAAAHPPCVEVQADKPTPWCGCVHPPCAGCLTADDASRQTRQ